MFRLEGTSVPQSTSGVSKVLEKKITFLKIWFLHFFPLTNKKKAFSLQRIDKILYSVKNLNEKVRKLRFK